MFNEPDAWNCAQEERTERARSALAARRFTITQNGPGHWTVQNGDQLPYEVRKSPEGWSCTCPDYLQNGGLRCKHIEAIRLTLDSCKEVTMNEQEMPGGWVRLYHPAGGGVQVTLPVPAASFSPGQTAAMFANVSSLIAAGFMVRQPGLQEGETRESVTHILHRNRALEDGSFTPVMDLYATGSFRVLSLYLDAEKEDETRQFIDRFGPISSFPLYPGNAPIERGKDAESEREFVVCVAERGVQVVYRANPKYSQEEADRLKAENKPYKVPKRIFVRFEKNGSAVSAVASAATPVPAAAPGGEKCLPEAGRLPERVYLDGSKVNGNVAEQDAYDAFRKLLRAAPTSKEALRRWIAAGGK